MRRPDEVTRILRRQFDRDYPSWARGQGRSWPWQVTLHPPSTIERAEDPVGCHEWASAWAGYTGPGVVEYTNLRFPTGKTHRMPKHLVLARPGDVAAAHPDNHATWRRCGQRLTRLQQHFPHAVFQRVVRLITELDEQDFERLQAAATWLRDHPTSGMLLRQLPIEGIHTKWLTRHATLVLAMLGDDQTTADPRDGEPADRRHVDGNRHPASWVDASTDSASGGASRRRRLHARLGLRVPPDLVQVSVCDPQLRAHVGGMRHFAASVEDLNSWPAHPTAVAILENKETGYAVTEDLPGTVILHGHGRYVEQYARITWVRNAQRVVYWGDLDVAGLQFISDLRAHGIHAATILTDKATLEQYRHLTVPGPTPVITATPPHLTETEQQLLQLLTEYTHTNGTGLLLEQERIPWPVAAARLSSALTGLQSRRPTAQPSEHLSGNRPRSGTRHTSRATSCDKHKRLDQGAHACKKLYTYQGVHK